MQGFDPLFWILGDRIEALRADCGYDADAFREGIAKAGVEAVIPAKQCMTGRNVAGTTSSKASSTNSRLAAYRHTLCQIQRVLPRLHHARLNQAVAALYPQSLGLLRQRLPRVRRHL